MHIVNDKLITFIDPSDIEPEAMQQLKNTASLPFIYHHVAAMPDCHFGMGATVGSVIATKGTIMPAAVGVDIGCGMIAVKTKFKASELPDDLKSIRVGLERRVPLGAGGRNSKMTDTALKRAENLLRRAKDYYSELDKKWDLALGSLGSGNHFIEICLDENDQVWCVLHSGSRGIGNKLAQMHIKTAQKLMEDYFISLPDQDLAYLIENTPEFRAYIEDLLWAQDFALFNREEMMDRAMTELSYTMYGENGHQHEIELERINCHHNFTQLENHMGQNVWITRKGAIQMRKGQLGVIPGSMGTRSYVVSGLENVASFHSAPHGAGRRMSRKKARESFSVEDLIEQTKGVECRKDAALLDEIPAAYKDIDQVMENSKELVEIKHVLRQIVNVKGS